MAHRHIKELDLDRLKRGRIHKLWMDVVTDTLGEPIAIPLIIAHGSQPGPVLGVTAAVHGNELNGIPVIQKVIKELDVTTQKGTIIGVPGVNVVSILRRQRRFIDGTDLNHIMPGDKNGNVSEVYAYRFFNKIVQHFDYLIDLHTASNGRINSYYIRADMTDKVTAELARLQNAEIIVHNPPSDGTLRGAASEIGIPSITVEIGNPNVFQKNMIGSSLTGIHNALSYLGYSDRPIEPPEEDPVLCENSYWLYTQKGGMVRVLSDVRQVVESDEVVAIQHDIFGDKLDECRAPERGIVIGKQVSPIGQSGGRILHLGILKT
ncbi:MAG: succinylglutamate desuccinylase/aspartoacylase family protein [Saprospiraceae bacterium]|nr:succinylglutamate desuccinylase/aspartoacylase family protein [Saprospiraceae bacterium]